jgi:SNF2 family DNA or RNA helicase
LNYTSASKYLSSVELQQKQNIMDKFRWFIEKAGIDFKQHQYDGVEWCIAKENDSESECRGGFIADEMGLGKTITMIATILLNFTPRTLIIVPNVLLDQWCSEIYRTTGYRPLVFHGYAKKNISKLDLYNARIVIATYGAIAVSPKDIEKGVTRKQLSLLHQIKWGRIIFDEGHHLRNKNARHFGADLLVAKIRWIVSGTPIQNSKRDFFNLCSALKMPFSYYTKPDNLPIIVSNFMLKRSKAQAGIVIPPVQPHFNSIRWNNPLEKQLSVDIHKAATAHSRLKLKMFMHARQSCILPAMIQPFMDNLIDSGFLSKDNTPSNDTVSSFTSKIDTVAEAVIQRKDNGNRKIVFSHFRTEIDTLQQRLSQAGITDVAVFDGRVPQSRRNILLKQNLSVIIIQIQTGCEGLNLQHFSEVYFVSPHWNPAVEDQAVARCHRIGQTKPVQVFRFNMDSLGDSDSLPSLEQYINDVQLNKRVIAKQIISE